ncbi:MAG TPA: peptide-N-glycosidase F-related protein [Chitinophagales bacterium]|nr:peptide-N-glycosidase F-related protein [Chitinophagales bacterium]
MKIFLLCCITLFFAESFAAEGDTTIIVAHTQANLSSPPSDDDAWVVFPGNKTYQRIILKFTLGCGIPHCSGWDYTVNTLIGKKTGMQDSTISGIDTLTHDTTWNYSDQVEFIEIGRLITPYGTYMAAGSNGFDNSWTHPYFYDITDYALFLKDSVAVRIHYDGWTDAFSATIEFLLIEGLPSRAVSNVTEIYHTYIGYPDKAGFESIATPKSFMIPLNTASAKVSLFMTGHGSQGEFDPHSFHLKVNGNEVYTRLLWKNDCGMNAIAPQGGTWIFNRANWCPGEKVPVYEIDITPYVMPGQIATIDLDFDDYVVQAGESAGYGTSMHLITYSSQHDHDVMLEEIIAPNNDKPYLRFNPISTNPVVKIKNMGKLPLFYAEISYWVEGGSKWYYEWTGNLLPFESEIIKLPAFDWNSSDSANTTFNAEARWPNDVPDEYVYNNHLASQFSLTPRLDTSFIITLRTNNHPEENWYVLRNEDGDTILFKNNLAASATYRDTIHLAAGSYALDLYDYDVQWEGGDGLSWWLNTQQGWETAGSFILRRSNNTILKSFTADFGSNVHYEFTVGYALGGNPPKTAPEPPFHTTGMNEPPVGASIHVFPNPAEDVVTVQIDLSKPAPGKIVLTDIFGKILHRCDFQSQHKSLTISANDFSPGIYFLCLMTDGFRINKKVILH